MAVEAQPPEPRRRRWEARWVEVNGSKIFLRVTGTGTPILFLHGYPQTSLTWRSAFDALADEHTCYAPDLPGWGRSSSGPDPTLASFVNDIAQLIVALELAPVIVVGHDWGAAIAYGLATEHPELVRRIVTVNFSPGRFQIWRALHFAFFSLPVVPEVVMKLWPAAVERRLLRWWSGANDAFPPPVLESYRVAAASSEARRTTLASYRDLVYRALVGNPPLRMGPTGSKRARPPMKWGAIWGMRDPIATPKVLDAFTTEFPEVDVRRIDDAGHFPHEETPRAFVAALRELLAI